MIQKSQQEVVFTINIKSFAGTIIMIQDMVTEQHQKDDGCYKLMAIESDDGELVHYVVSPATYVLGHVSLAIGDKVTGYYDGNAPAPLIFPPQYQAIVMAKDHPEQHVKVDYFNADFVSSDGQLALNLSPATQVVLTNGQTFTGNFADRNLIVIYGPATKSIPAWTTPYQIIVLCG